MEILRGVSPRLDESEWLDEGRGSAADAADNLGEMWRLNRWLGGFSALTRHLYPRLRATSGPCTVLDLGTGSAQMLLALARGARDHSAGVRLYGLDSSARNLSIARRHTRGCDQISLALADAQQLPMAGHSADFVISSLFLHHFAPGRVAELLRAAFATARRALIMTDLVRGALPLLAFRLVQPALAPHPLTRHDGLLSIQRAYTPAELLGLAAVAGLPGARVYAHWPWRMTLVVDQQAND